MPSRCHEDALRPVAQQLRQIVLVKVQRQLPEVVAVQRQDVEGVEGHVEKSVAGARRPKSLIGRRSRPVRR